MSVVVDTTSLASRVKRLLDTWQADVAGWGNAASVAFVRGPAQKDDTIRYSKSLALQYWLFGYEFPDTLVLLTPSELHVLASAKKLALLSPAAGPLLEQAGLTLLLHEKGKASDGVAETDNLLAVARAAGGVLGAPLKEKDEGGMSTVWLERLTAAGLSTADVAPGLALAMAPKDETEVTALKRAANLSASVLQRLLVAKLEGAVDEGARVKHSALADAAEAAAADPNPPPVAVKLRAENIEMCYPFVVQSGGKYDLNWKAGSDDRVLSYEPSGVVLAAMGCRYKFYCSNVGRTYLFNPPKGVADAYAALLAAHTAAIQAVRADASCGSVYEAAVAALRAAPGGEALVPHLTKTVGSVTGLEFQEKSLQLSPGSAAVIKASTAFNVTTGLEGLVNEAAKEGSKDRVYSLLLADTVLATAGGQPPEVCTTVAKNALSDVCYEISGEDEDGADEAAPAPRRAEAKEMKVRAEATGAAAEARRKEKQAELASEKNAETLRRLTEAKQRNAASVASSGVASDYKVYASVAEVPSNQAKEACIVVDRAKDAVLLPLYGALVPFHIGTVKNCTSAEAEGVHVIRISFNVPGAAFGSANAYPPVALNPNATYLREVAFRCTDGRHAAHVVGEVKQLRAASKARATELATRATLVRQDKLQLSKGRIHRLPDVWVRPAFSGRRKATGTLECHANGFRYSAAKAEDKLDIIFSNIKHAFFQDASNKELITVLHFHLHEPIMVGKKKTADVQFFAEVMEATQNIDGGRRGMYDADELEDEQRERERRKRINDDFLAFTKRVQDVWNTGFADLDLEFEVPFRDLSFPGVPFKATSVCMPTVRALVDLIETPQMVITLSEVEVVNLERVGFSLKNFDMCIVFKDFNREVHRIDAIESRYLEGIKEWLSSVNIKYYESKMNLNWKPILKHILNDPQDFVDQGGWDFLDLEGGDEEDEGEEESEGYAPSDGAASGGEEEEESSDEESVEDSDDEDEEDGEDEDEEEAGKDWDELEKEALHADKDVHEDSDDDRKRKGGKAGLKAGKGPPPKKGKY